MSLLERVFIRLWNRTSTPDPPNALHLGHLVLDGEATRKMISLPHKRRPEHIAILGKTGAGKSTLLRFFCNQDIRGNHGFIFFDLHGDATDRLLALIEDEERRRGADLSQKVVVIDPADREFAVGLNVLSGGDNQQGYVRIAEIAQLLRDRWHLDTLGVRTEELLRNALLVLRENDLTLLELAPLLTSPTFRLLCVGRAKSTDARSYFQSRFEPLSEPMKGIFREAVLNKITAFSADPHFRHILGQRNSFDLSRAVDSGYWIIINLDKGRLGDGAATLGSLLLSRIKHTLFARSSRRLLTLYCDELQNLVGLDGGIQSLFAEARKLGVSVVSANQYLEQYPSPMRSAVLSVGTQIYFQLGGRDAGTIATVLGGGRMLKRTLRDLPQQEFVLKTSTDSVRQVRVPNLSPPVGFGEELYRRSIRRYGRPRSEIEEEIEKRHSLGAFSERALDAWD